MSRLTRAVPVMAIALAYPKLALAQDVAAPQAEGASDNSQALEEIVVVAQKRAQNVQDVPIAITALTSEQLQTSGVVSTSQLNVAIPGVNVRQTVGSFQPSIRGVGTSSNNAENPVALYIDDVYYPFQREGARELNDLAQIAVLKGPQGTLFGRNATGGVIQLTTRRPQQDFGGFVNASIDNYATLRTDAYITGGLSSAIAASLSAGYTTQGEGWGENSTTGNDTFIIHQNWSVRGKLLFEPDNLTEILIIGDYQDRDEDIGSYNRPYPGTTLRLPGFVDTGNVHDSGSNLDSNLTLKAGGVSLKASRDMGFAEITSISAFRRASATAQWDVDGTPTLGQNNFNENSTRMFSQELQIVSPSSGDFHWAVGAYYLNYRNGLTPFTRFFYGILAPNPTSNAKTTIEDRERTESFAPFAQVDFTLLPKTRLTLGARWTYEKRTFDATTVSVRNNGTSTTASVHSEQTVRKPSWRVSVDHEFSESVLGYASYNRGIKSGGYNVAQPTSPAYDPETLDAYEVGLKTELFDNALRLNLAGFFYSYKDLQLSKYVAGSITITNAASAELYGLDADFEARLTPEFRLSGGVSLIHSEYTSYPNAQIITPNPAGGIIAREGDVTGNRLQLAQEISASITATYSKRFQFGRIDLSVTESHNGDYYFEADNFARQPAYDAVNASAAWTSPSDAVTATIFVRNLLDEKIIGQAGSVTTVGLTTTYTYAPRVYGASVRVRF